MGSAPLSLDLFWVTLALYLAAFISFILYVAVRKRIFTTVGFWLCVVGWPIQLASIVLRGIEGGHWPLGNMYEYSTGISFVLVTLFLILGFRSGQRLVGLPVTGVVIALMGVGYMLYEPPGDLVPALHSYWLTIHVTAMASSSAILTFSFFFGMAYLYKSWCEQKELHPEGGGKVRRMLANLTPSKARNQNQLAFAAQGSGSGSLPVPTESTVAAAAATSSQGIRLSIGQALPASKKLDALSYRFVMIGFPVWTFGVICGAIWGEQAWGRYWGWDPKETFAFATWLVFAIYLHARVTFGWKEKRTAWITAVGFIFLLFTLYAVNLWIVGLHSYARA